LDFLGSFISLFYLSPETMIPIRSKDGAPSPRREAQAVREADSSRVVPKPVPERQVKDARTYQTDQIRRRYSPKESTVGNGDTSFLFNLSPSDPDFPFDLDHLECDLRVPRSYPSQPPRLFVKNSNIPRGFAINIEKGWDQLVKEKRGATLLALTNALDKKLESFLTEKKAETIKLVAFKDTRHLDAAPTSSNTPPVAAPPSAAPTKQPVPAPVSRPYIPEESYTRDQINEAKARRAQEVRQLEARMGRLPLYHKSSDGIVYTLPIEPKRRTNLPIGLQAVKSVQLIIPLLYPLQTLRILLNDVDSSDAEPVEELFSKKADEQKQMSLTSHVNYLAQNLHLLAKQAAAQATPSQTSAPVADSQQLNPDMEAKEAEHTSTLANTGDRPHLHVIPRPPEWSLAHDSEEDDSDYSDDEEDYDQEDGGAAIEQPSSSSSLGAAAVNQTAEKGTALTFPSVELHGIELLQISILNLIVKCDRCKTLNEVTNLKDGVEKVGSCKKCATAFAVRFRPELIHQNSTRAGFIDASGCAVSDMLASTFVPTCNKCSTPAQQGFVSVRGETTTNVCRECHARFTFKPGPDVKFLAYSPSLLRVPNTMGPRRKQEKLGLHAGEPLPDKGACAHYKRSYRWFRFSCCSKVYPCDKCHAASEDHADEWANRMICGWCSREQNYRVDSCQFCGRSVIGKRGSGYWEGGKGTRNRVLMRRGDKRKYRRVGGTDAAAAAGKKKDKDKDDGKD